MVYYIFRSGGKPERAEVAKQVERILGKDEVTSSNLVISSINQSLCGWFFYGFGVNAQELW